MKLNLEKLGKKNICLIGLMGAGKSVAGKLLAKELRMRYYDSDKLIEKKLHKSINQIFSDHGESYFRNIEEDIVLSLLDKKNCVISLGGGSILSDLTRKALFINSFSIYLEVDIEILHERLIKSKKRPLINNKDIKEKLIHLTQERSKYYREANLTVNNLKNTEEALKKIKTQLQKYYE